MKFIPSSKKEWVFKDKYKKSILLENVPGEILAVQESVHPEGKEITPHKHEDMSELFYIIEGKALAKIADKEFEVNTGDLILIEKEEKHYLKFLKESKILVIKLKQI